MRKLRPTSYTHTLTCLP
uniref:Uncharacterized protein n=1 Tax=Arundo donax TaxID=35708 RepID=A0A0A9CF81_ARUDO